MRASVAAPLLATRRRGRAPLSSLDCERVERFLAFGIDMVPELAEPTLDDVDAAVRRWVDVHGLDEPNDDELARLLRAAVSRSLVAARHRTPNAALSLGISGGYDSRPILWALRELGEEPFLYTYGQPGNIDFDIAGVLDARLGLGIQRFDSNAITWRLDDFDSEATLTHDLPLSPRVPVGRMIDELTGPRIEVHGWLNGALSGAGAVPHDAPRERQIEAFAAGNDPFGFQQLMGRARVRALLPLSVVRDDRAISTYRQLDIAFRQWQRIRLPDRPGRHLSYPYCSGEWIGFWLSRPHEQIESQHRWLQFVRSLPSELFPDVVGLDGGRQPVRRARLARLYGGAEEAAWSPVPAEVVAPANPTHHFSLVATARNNPSFSAMLTESLGRLRGRRIVDAALIDRVERGFAADDAAAARMLNGLVTLDTCLESGRFFD